MHPTLKNGISLFSLNVPSADHTPKRKLCPIKQFLPVSVNGQLGRIVPERAKIIRKKGLF